MKIRTKKILSTILGVYVANITGNFIAKSHDFESALARGERDLAKKVRQEILSSRMLVPYPIEWMLPNRSVDYFEIFRKI